MAELPKPSRGEIWDAVFPGDPPGKPPRPVLVVSTNNRNRHPRASTVLVVPFSTTLSEYPTHIRLAPGETGLAEISELQPEQISSVRKEYLKARAGTRVQGEATMRKIAKFVMFALGVLPQEIQ